jgi:ABC-2 type transport system permease protein
MIYLSIVRMYVKATMEYRMAFIAGFIGNVVRKIAEYLSIWVLLSSFRVIDGWSFGDVLMLYNINQFAI